MPNNWRLMRKSRLEVTPSLPLCPWARRWTLNCSRWHLVWKMCVKGWIGGCSEAVKVLEKALYGCSRLSFNTVREILKLHNRIQSETSTQQSRNQQIVHYKPQRLPACGLYLKVATHERKKKKSPTLRNSPSMNSFCVFFSFFFLSHRVLYCIIPILSWQLLSKKPRLPFAWEVYLAAWQLEELPALSECLERQRWRAEEKQNTSRVRNRAGVNDNGSDSD